MLRRAEGILRPSCISTSTISLSVAGAPARGGGEIPPSFRMAAPNRSQLSMTRSKLAPIASIPSVIERSPRAETIVRSGRQHDTRRLATVSREPLERAEPSDRCDRGEESNMSATVIKNADWAIAWQAQPGRHVYMRNVDVAFDGNTITHVGKDYVGAADAVVDGRKRMV